MITPLKEETGDKCGQNQTSTVYVSKTISFFILCNHLLSQGSELMFCSPEFHGFFQIIEKNVPYATLMSYDYVHFHQFESEANKKITKMFPL